jgi:hypothetical protein
MPETIPNTAHSISLPRFLWHLFIAVIIWLFINLIIFVIVSFLAFILINAQGMANPDDAFTLALACAIPSALITSSLVAVRKLIPRLWRPDHA